MATLGNTITPQPLGIALYLDHVFGSRELIDVMYGLGVCASYTELRTYKTSAAIHTLESSQIVNADRPTYIPLDLKKKDEEGSSCGLLHEGADNIDINVETKDGKNTFHALARFMFQDQTVESTSVNLAIPRIKDRSIKETEEVLQLTKCEPYQLPSKRPVPPISHDILRKINNLNISNQATNGTKETAWLLLRMIPRGVLPITSPPDKSVVPLWKGYNAKILIPNSCRLQTKTHRAHLPIIDAKPSDKTTLYTSMVQCKRLTNSLGQKSSLQTMDQQLYAIGQEIKWHLKDEFESHTLRLGSFHGNMSFLSCIGKIWGDAGLRDLLVDSGVYAAGTAELFMQGKEYNRSVTAFIYVYEVLSQLRFTEFLKWLQEKNEQLPDELWNQLSTTKDLFLQGVAPHSAITELQDLIENHVQPKMALFRAEASVKSPTFQSWDSLIEAIHILLLDLRAEREGDWPLSRHVSLARTPYYACGDKVHYTHYSSVSLMDMLALPDDVEAAFMRGEFSVRETCGAFIGTATDMATEHKIKELKGPAGLKHFSKKMPALIRFSLTRHLTAEWATHIKERAKHKDTQESHLHKEERKTAMLKDEENVQKLVGYINDHMRNPFSTDEDMPNVLINISTGMHATPEVQNSLLNCVEEGKNKFDSFVESRLSVDGKRNFHDPIKQTKLKTFKDLSKSIKLKTSTGVKQVKINPEMILRRSIALTRFRSDLDLLDIMSLPMGGAPLSIFYDNGLMRKPTKADLAHILEEGISPLNSWPKSNPNMSVYILDVMVLLHKIPVQSPYKTFGDLVQDLLANIIKKYTFVDTVICVFDQYNDPNDVKAYERRRRITIEQQSYNVMDSAKLPKWKQFLELDKNKTEFCDFMSKYFVTNAPSSLKDTHRLILTGGFEDGTVTKEIRNNSVSELSHMKTNQLQADYRMIFMADQMHKEFTNSNTRGTIILSSTDTDVLVLACHHTPHFTNAEVFWETGTTTKYENNHRFVPVNDIIKQHGEDMMRILPAIHALSGCDTTSALFYIGKKNAFKVVSNQGPKNFSNLSSLSENNIIKAEDAARALVSLWYDSAQKYKSLHGNLNQLRTKMASIRDIPMSRLPPCEAVFRQHVLRVMWQLRLWVNARTPELVNGSPFDFGWEKKDGNIEPVMYEGQTTAEKISGLTCNCKGKKRCKVDCSCYVNNLPCIELCLCGSEENKCHNPTSFNNEEIEDDISQD